MYGLLEADQANSCKTTGDSRKDWKLEQNREEWLVEDREVDVGRQEGLY